VIPLRQSLRMLVAADNSVKKSGSGGGWPAFPHAFGFADIGWLRVPHPRVLCEGGRDAAGSVSSRLALACLRPASQFR
jgi:hypothetical protein